MTKDNVCIDCLSWFSGKNFASISGRELLQEATNNSLVVIREANSSFREKSDGWHHIKQYKDEFEILFKTLIKASLTKDGELQLKSTDRLEILTFFIYSFNSLEIDFVRDQIKKYLPMSIWINLSESRRNYELSMLPKSLRLAWQRLENQQQNTDKDKLEEKTFERKFLFNYLLQFLDILNNVVESGDSTENQTTINQDSALFCLKFLEFIIDIESQLTLRRFFHAFLTQTNFIERCRLSRLARTLCAEGYLFSQLVDLLSLYCSFEVKIVSGESLTDIELMRKHEQRVLDLQRILWKNFTSLKDYALKSIQSIDNKRTLSKMMSSLENEDEVFDLLKLTGLACEQSLNLDDRKNIELMKEIFITFYARKESQLQTVNSIPLLPSEFVIWDTNLVPDKQYRYEHPLPLPKLNLQFISIADYFLRNFVLFKNESTYEIRRDLEDGILRSKCKWNQEGQFVTGPKQRMALIIKEFSILNIGKSKLGENCPSEVQAKVVINMDYVRPDWKEEWEKLRKHDICFLISFNNPEKSASSIWPQDSFPQKVGLKYVRGCEVEGLLDDGGKIVDGHSETPAFKNNLRTFIVKLDRNQFQLDTDNFERTKQNVYEKFHLIVRKKPEQNNFKGVLETIKSLLNADAVVPDWLKNLLIGYGDPNAAIYSNVKSLFSNGIDDDVECLDYFDTFLSEQHAQNTLTQIMPEYTFKRHHLYDKDPSKQMIPPFKVKFNEKQKTMTCAPYKLKLRSPYTTTIPRRNSIEFTPTQVQAITSGLRPGLTMIFGSPGSCKTDVALQIISCLYHTYPNQRTLVVTHSNSALNALFEKIIELDVEKHHLLRLGHGEDELQSPEDYSHQGRAKHVLDKISENTALVEKLARSLELDVPSDGFTCETSEYFHFYHILTRWEAYVELVQDEACTIDDVKAKFPFSAFFDDLAIGQLFAGKSVGDDFEVAKNCYRYIKGIFDRLREFRPFELFQSHSNRSIYLQVKVAKIIAMTCTHAGLRRKKLVDMSFQYDTILMDEAARFLDIETTIPLLLQSSEHSKNRLKRWIMIGDHKQLPPIVQNSALQKYCNMDQSLFKRFVRLGVPTIDLG